jgi:hypothetical protein
MSEEIKVDLSKYITRYTSTLTSKATLPPLNIPDGPTWNDRVKRAEKIALIVQRAQEDMEDRYFDIRQSILEQIQQSAPAGCRVEGSGAGSSALLIVPKGVNVDFLKTFEPKL